MMPFEAVTLMEAKYPVLRKCPFCAGVREFNFDSFHEAKQFIYLMVTNDI